MDYDAAVAAGVITEHNPTNEYIDSILSAIDVEAIKNAQLRIALDPMYGVSQTARWRRSSWTAGAAISALQPTATRTASA